MALQDLDRHLWGMQRDYFIVFMIILAITSAVLAFTQRLRGDIHGEGPVEKFCICAFRAIGSTLIFLSLAILTPPGPTCLFPNPDRSAAEKSLVPHYTSACVCTTLIVLFSALAPHFKFVSDANPKSVEDIERGAAGASPNAHVEPATAPDPAHVAVNGNPGAVNNAPQGDEEEQEQVANPRDGRNDPLLAKLSDEAAASSGRNK